MTHRYQPIHNARKALLDNISAIQQAHDDSILRTKNAFRLKDALSAQKFGLLAGCFQQDLFDEELQNASEEIQKIRSQEDLTTKDEFVMSPINNQAISLFSTVVTKDLTIPMEYQDFAEFFNKEKAIEIPPYRGPGVDFTIEIEPGKALPNKPAYPCSDAELQTQREYIKEYLERK